MSDSKNLTLRQVWEPMVGRLMLTCGDIELRLLQIHWNANLNKPRNDSFKLYPLAKKIRSLMVDVDALDLEPPVRKELVSALNGVLKLMEIRNLVAHSPLYLDIYSNEKGEFRAIGGIRSLRDHEKHVSHAKLNETIQFAVSLEERLSSLVLMLAYAMCPPVDSHDT